MRLQRILAAAGIAARRVAERMIEEGRVSVNGQVVSTLPAFADPERDHIVVDGRPLPKQPARFVYIMLNKPERVLSVVTDEPGLDRTTVMDLVKHPTAPRLYPVGRLEFETSGLVLMTNDGDLANRLTHPRYGIPRVYRAVVKGRLDGESLERVQRDLSRLLKRENRRRMRDSAKATPLSGEAVTLDVESTEPDRTTLRIIVREGRTISAPPGLQRTSPTEPAGGGAGGEGGGGVGELLAAVGLRIRSLERIAIGPLELANVGRGRWRELERRELYELRAAARGTGPKLPRSIEGERSGPAAKSMPARRISSTGKSRPAGKRPPPDAATTSGEQSRKRSAARPSGRPPARSSASQSGPRRQAGPPASQSEGRSKGQRPPARGTTRGTPRGTKRPSPSGPSRRPPPRKRR